MTSRLLPNILFTGTPGTGKSTLGERTSSETLQIVACATSHACVVLLFGRCSRGAVGELLLRLGLLTRRVASSPRVVHSTTPLRRNAAAHVHRCWRIDQRPRIARGRRSDVQRADSRRGSNRRPSRSRHVAKQRRFRRRLSRLRLLSWYRAGVSLSFCSLMSVFRSYSS